MLPLAKGAGGEGFDLAAAFTRWLGPAFIVLGMIYGAVYLVETDVFGPPERLTAGIAVTVGFGWLGQYLLRRGQYLLGELVTGTFFAGAFLCAWAVPTVTGWPIGSSILLSGLFGFLALAYSWARSDSTTFAIGVAGLAGIPISGPLYADVDLLATVSDLYGQQQMMAPLMLFIVLAFGARLAKGWFLPWALTLGAVFSSFASTLNGGGAPEVQIVVVTLLAVSSLLGVVRGEVDDGSVLQRHLDPLFRVVDAAIPVLALWPVWLLVDELGFSKLGQRVSLVVWATVAAGLAATLYRGAETLAVERNRGRQIGGLLSAVVAVLLAIGNLDWQIYVVALAAAFVAAIVVGNEPNGKDVTDEPGAGLLDLIQIALGVSTGVGLLLMVLSGLVTRLADDVSASISAWVAVGLFATGFCLRAELRSWWGVPYGFGLGLLVATLGDEPAALMVTSAVWLFAGLAAVKFGLARDLRTGAVVGLSTIAVAVGKILLVDTPQFDGNLMRAVSFLAAGLVLVLVSAESGRIRQLLNATSVSTGKF